MKKISMEKLYCGYREKWTGNDIVTGCGNLDAELVLVGEAPGKEEVRLLQPFVGAAGRNLAAFLERLELGRDSIYITNAIKYRLSKINPKTGRIINRPALKEEILQNRSSLIDEIQIIKPKFIVTLGNVPLRTITGDLTAVIGKAHGIMTDIKLGDNTYKLLPLYHPASIIYNRSLQSIYFTDLMHLKTFLEK